MEKTEKLIMQEDAWKPLKEMNLTDDFLFDVATTELENCKTIIELSTGLRLKSLKWKEGQNVYSRFLVCKYCPSAFGGHSLVCVHSQGRFI